MKFIVSFLKCSFYVGLTTASIVAMMICFGFFPTLELVGFIALGSFVGIFLSKLISTFLIIEILGLSPINIGVSVGSILTFIASFSFTPSLAFAGVITLGVAISNFIYAAVLSSLEAIFTNKSSAQSHDHNKFNNTNHAGGVDNIPDNAPRRGRPLVYNYNDRRTQGDTMYTASRSLPRPS